MELKDVRIAAGVGGKIRKTTWKKGTYSLVLEDGLCFHFQPPHGVEIGANTILLLDDPPSDNWELFESERIEVGDVVRAPRYDGGVCECDHKVLSVNPETGKAHITGQMMLVDVDKLTLIRKGPKVHVFEEVSLQEKHHVYQVCFWTSNHKLMDFMQERGKDFDMILTERPE